MGSGNPLTDPAALDRMLVWRGVDGLVPHVEPLSRAEIAALKEGDHEALIDKAVQMFQRDIWEQGADPDYLHNRSYGFAIQHKARERLLKYLLPVERQGEVSQAKAMPQDALIALLNELRGGSGSTQQGALTDGGEG